MLEGIFDIPFCEQSDYNNSNINLNNNNLNCASSLKKPDPLRSYFAGLINQGGTCYMNSVIQVLFFNPKLRKLILEIPLFKDINRTDKDESVLKGHKHDILVALQELFSKLYLSNSLVNTTTNLTKAFGWEGNDVLNQQDAQEFIKIFLFEVMERIFSNTQYENFLKSLFELSTERYLTCKVCNTTKSNIENSYDLNLIVKGNKDVNSSLSMLFGNSSTEVISDYFCEICNKKVNIYKTTYVKTLPSFLILGLCRMDFDYNTFERIKLNDNFEFPLELDMKSYLNIEDTNKKTNIELETNYELYALVIHRGNPYGGHYFSYIRDLTNEGSWDLENMECYESSPSLQNEDKKLTIENNKDNKKKHQKDNKNSKSKKQLKKEDEEHLKLSFDKCDYPIPYKNKELTKNWYCFDDTSIFPIRVGRLQKQFKSKESAYILFYIRKGTILESSYPLSYFSYELIQQNNERLKEQENYFKKQNCLNVRIHNDENFNITKFNNIKINKNRYFINKERSETVRSFNDENIIDTDTIMNNNSHLLTDVEFTDTLEEFIKKYINKFNKHDLKLSNIKSIIKLQFEKYNLRITVTGIINCNNPNFYNYTIKDLGIKHFSDIIIIKEDSKLKEYINLVSNNIDISCDNMLNTIVDTIEFKVNYMDKNSMVEFCSSAKYNIFKKYILNYFNIDLSQKENYLIYYKNKSNIIYLDNICYDSKKDIYLNLNQLKLSDKTLYISKQNKLNNLKIKDIEGNIKGSDILNKEEELINLYVKIEGKEEVNIIQVDPLITFNQLDRILKENLKDKLNKDDFNINYPLRIRKYLDNSIVYKEDYKNIIISDPVFDEGAVNLTIEMGDIYLKSQILIKVIVKQDNGEEFFREFIGTLHSKLCDIKKLLCEEYFPNKDIKNYRFYKTSWLGEPDVEIKNEAQDLKNAKIKDNDTVYIINNMFKNSCFVKLYLTDNDFNKYFNYDNKTSVVYTSDTNDCNTKLYYNTILDKPDLSEDEKMLKHFLDNEEESKNSIKNFEEIKELIAITKKLDYIHKPILDSDYRFNIEFSNNREFIELKKLIAEKFSPDALFNNNKMNYNNIRLRIISDNYEAQNIIADGTTIKNIDLKQPYNILAEITSHEVSCIKKNEILLSIFERDISNKSYITKGLNVIFKFDNGFSTIELKKQLVKYLIDKNFINENLEQSLKKLDIAKYSKSLYKWGFIEDEDNLKKSKIALKDGDFIGYILRKGNEVDDKKIMLDNWQTKEDQKIIELLKPINSIKKIKYKDINNKKRGKEVAITIKLKDD